MESRIKEILDKYWEGHTSLEEEQLIKDYFRSNPSLAGDGQYFRAIEAQAKVKYQGSTPGSKKFPNRQWMTVAATIALGVMVGIVALDNSRQKDPFAITDPQEAYEVTREALMMISNNLNENSQYPGELKKINKAEELIKE